MGNSFLTVQEIAREALVRLENNLVMRQLVHTDFSNEFAKKGDTIKVKIPATFEANDFEGTITTQDINEGEVPVTLDKIADVSVAVTSKELTLSIDDFGFQVVEGAMQALAQKIDHTLTGLYADIPYFYGTAGQTPNSLKDISGVRKILNNNKVPNVNRRLVFDPEAEAELIVLDAIVNAEKSGSTAALREASMGRILGFDTFMDQNVRTHIAGDYAALTDVTATGEAGSNTVTLESAAGTSTGKLNKGDLLVINGQQYVVTEDTAPAVSGTLTAKVYPNLKSAYNGAPVTFVGDHVANLAFHRNAFAFVNRPMALPSGGADGYVETYNGLSIRVTRGYDMKTKQETISFDILYGVKTIHPELAARLLG